MKKVLSVIMISGLMSCANHSNDSGHIIIVDTYDQLPLCTEVYQNFIARTEVVNQTFICDGVSNWDLVFINGTKLVE